MGPNYEQADRQVGRKRLPPGYVAVLNDDERLALVVAELHAHMLSGAAKKGPRVGVLFRQVGAADRDGIDRLLIDSYGASALLKEAAVFRVADDFHYVIDSECVAHVWNRHADPVAEQQSGQVPIEVADLVRVPDAMRLRNIVEFAVTKGIPRIVYEQATVGDRLRVVGEVQPGRRWVVVRTVYKRK